MKTIEQIDEEVRIAELEQPYYDKLEQAHEQERKKRDKEFREFIMGDKYNARIFKEKMEESLRDINEMDLDISRYYENLDKAGAEMKEWWMWLIDRRIDDKLMEEKQLKRWGLCRDICLGKLKDKKGMEDFDLLKERAKEVEIAEIMPYKADSRSGNRRYYKCPLHEEKTASFVEYIDQKSYACYGCQAAGDTIDLFMRLNSCDFVTAIKTLSKY